ncbi:putative PPE family protein PPE29 [Mycobacterium parmense]|uniref:Putative PPE family protein PPE29 n=2 Tax=Mycobacterium parmense TaxID=185642 RepID=A0A7I7YTP6_9MYCO|nr:putative PPE family protein PPE29 [Mycobacterium parmense]
MAAAAAWDGLAAELRSAAASYGSVISGLSAGPWLGPASASMAAAAGPFAAWTSATAAQAEQTAAQARAAAAVYEVAFAATVPPPLIAANRAQLMALIATNIFGQNTPAIMATEAEYGEMWAQDVAAMYGYAGVSASAATLTPFTPPPQSINTAGLGAQAAALARATATSVTANTQLLLSQFTSAVPAALQGLASPVSSTPAAGLGILQTLGLAGPLSGITGPLQALGITTPASLLEPASTGIASAELTTASGAWSSASQGDKEILDNGDKIADDTQKITGLEDRIISKLSQSGLGGPAAPAASLGQASSVGALSVPSGWTAAAPEMRLSAVTLPDTAIEAAPEAFAAMPGSSMFGQMVLASMAGRAMTGALSPGGRERIRATTGKCPPSTPPPPTSPGESRPGIAVEIREFTELLSKLGALRDSGLLTHEEFDLQKQRLLAR